MRNIFCTARFPPLIKRGNLNTFSKSEEPKLHSAEFQYPAIEQQTLIQLQVSYLTRLNNVYISETDNKETPNTEFQFHPPGPVSITGLSHRAELA